MKKNQTDIKTINEDIDGIGVGPQGEVGPRGKQGIEGPDGPAGPDGTPVAGVNIESVLGATYYEIDLIAEMPETTIKFNIDINSLATDITNGLKIFFNGVEQTERISVLDDIIIKKLGSGSINMFFYDETGEATEYQTNSVPVSLIIQSPAVGFTFSFSEIIQGSTVGPTGPAGSTGPQGEDGPQGEQGIQGLPGEQNMRFLATYVDADTFPEYAERVMIQCVGGDYDGTIFIKEEMLEGSTCKNGPYATLVSIEDNGGTIQSILLNGVTSIRVYAIENLT